MSPAAQHSQPPPSRRRPRKGPDAFDVLSRDGAAAVLYFVRAKLEAERRRAPGLASTDLRVFVRRVEFAARTVHDGVFEDCVFIAPLFHVMKERGEVTSCPTLAAFKERLLEAHRRGLLDLEACANLLRANPLVVEASATRRRKKTYHLVQRWPERTVFATLYDVTASLSPQAYAAARAYAHKVRDDEKRREGRPRLITLSIEAFAARVQAVVNEGSRDALLIEFYRELDERGEMTGFAFSTFKTRLRAAHRAGLLGMRTWEAKDGEASESVNTSAVENHGMKLHLVCRTAAPLPIPWGRPAPLVRPAQVWREQGRI